MGSVNGDYSRLCLVFRFLTTIALNAGKKPGPLLRGHLRACKKCRRLYEASGALNVRLRRETPTIHSAYQSYLTEKTVSKLPPSSPRVATGSSTTIKYLLPASAAAIVLLVLGGWYFLARGKPLKPLPTQSISGISLYDMLSVETLMPGETVEENVLAEWPNWMEKPVTLEVEYLTRDAKTATNFLLAFLDAKTTP